MSESDTLLKPPGIAATPPVSIWSKPIQLQSAKFVGALAKGIFDAATGGWRDAGTDVEQAVDALGLKNGPGELAWKLVTRALTQALFELIAEVKPFPPNALLPDRASFEAKLNQALSSMELVIGRSFFDKPADLPLLGQLSEPLTDWLKSHGAPTVVARAIAQRLPSYFTYALHQEWRERSGDYVPILESLDTPFATATERERAWARYGARLQRQLCEPMFQEPFGLDAVYVPLRGYYEVEKARERDARGMREEDVEVTHHVVDVENMLMQWATLQGKEEPTLRIVAGGPGSGKSSLAKTFAAKLSARGVRVLYVPLHLIHPEKDIEGAIDAFVRQQDILPGLNSVFDERKLLLLLDGLDELAMQGKASAEVAQKFVEEVRRLVANRNQTEQRLQVLLGGREIVVQLCRSILRKPGQVLNLLPHYARRTDLRDFRDPQLLLEEDRREIWWRRYGVAKDKPYERMPEQLRRPDLDEITAQPLLGYLVALSYESGKVDFSRDNHLTRNDIYYDLVREVHKRTYAGIEHPSVRGFELDIFTQLLEEVGLATWHGNGRAASLDAIMAACERGGLSNWFTQFEEGAKSGATRLLTAFYFRQTGSANRGEQTFEFTHKSFGEYLTAGRIVRAIDTIFDEMSRRKKRPSSGWSERDALKHWAEICGPTEMDDYIMAFLVGEMDRRGVTVVADWQKMLAHLIGVMLVQGMPMDALDVRLPYIEQARQARNAEESLLAGLYACAQRTKVKSKIKWPEITSFGAWIRRMQGQRVSTENALALKCLAWLEIDGQALCFVDLFRANLFGASLRGADLEGANLVSATLSNADLYGAKLAGANVHDADIRGVTLDRNTLTGTRGTPRAK